MTLEPLASGAFPSAQPKIFAPGAGNARGGGLWPKEHGAYGQLLIPLLVGLFSPVPTIASGLLALGAVAAFLAHEPVLVVLGHRGPKARRTLLEPARKRIVLLATVAVLAIAGGIALAPSALPALLLVSALGVGLSYLIHQRSEKTPLGEVLAASTLSGFGFVTGVAGKSTVGAAALVWLAWIIGFASATGAVHAVLGKHKRGERRSSLLMLTAASLLCMTLVWLQAYTVLTCLPVVFIAWVVALVAPHPRHLKKVGWALVAATVTTALLMVFWA